MVEWVENRLFAILDVGFADGLFCARGMARRCGRLGVYQVRDGDDGEHLSSKHV
jgi:hypothetical protein